MIVTRGGEFCCRTGDPGQPGHALVGQMRDEDISLISV